MNLLEIRALSKSFPIEGGMLRKVIGAVYALQDVSLGIEMGSVVALVGGSGSGKSTLAKIVVGLLAPDQGTLLWERRPLSSFSRLDRARRIQMIFQDPFASLNPKLSVGTQLMDVVRLTDEPNPSVRCVELLDQVGLPADSLGHYPFQFSGGQRQRIAIARSLAMNPALLVADEPLSALDVTTQAKILDLFRELKKSYGLTMLFITHDLGVAHQFADHIVVLQDGRVVEQGATASVLQDPQHSYTRALLNAVPKLPW